MITVRLKGGLGNQLFQYATAYSLARRLEQNLQLDISFFPRQTLRGYKLDKFNIEFSEVAGETSKRLSKIELIKSRYLNKLLRVSNIDMIHIKKDEVYFLETGSKMMNHFFDLDYKNIYLDGYYQSELYFSDYRNDILRQFTPNYEQDEKYLSVLRQIQRKNSVAIHVRRGDFLNSRRDPNPRIYLLDDDYYRRAITYMNSKIENPTYFWFSDDIEWVRGNFGNRDNYYFVSLATPNADIDEMLLMSKCNNIISANSTFSWWAAWLNTNINAIKIVPQKRYGNPKMIPDKWIKM